MKDIVEQLQSFDFCGRILRDEAAAEILRLRAQLATARDATIEECADYIVGQLNAERMWQNEAQSSLRWDMDGLPTALRRALKGKP